MSVLHGSVLLLQIDSLLGPEEDQGSLALRLGMCLSLMVIDSLYGGFSGPSSLRTRVD